VIFDSNPRISSPNASIHSIGSPLKSFAKSFKCPTGETITRKCIAYLKKNGPINSNMICFKINGYSELINDAKKLNQVCVNLDIGETMIDTYNLAMEDFCEILVSYRELYWFRSDYKSYEFTPNAQNNQFSISGSRRTSEIKQPSGSPIPRRSVENTGADVQDEDIKEIEGEVNHIQIQDINKLKRNSVISKSQNVNGVIPPINTTCLTCLDELTFYNSLNLKANIGALHFNAYDSVTQTRPNSLKISTVQAKPFSQLTVPQTQLILSKDRENITFSAFGFTFSSSKPIGFSTFFISVFFTKCAYKSKRD